MGGPEHAFRSEKDHSGDRAWGTRGGDYRDWQRKAHRGGRVRDLTLASVSGEGGTQPLTVMTH